jgi:hypothetical protein
MKKLFLGKAGGNVMVWQEFLISLGFEIGDIDGLFGPLTEKGTKEFQLKYKLKADGVVGPVTYKKACSLGFGFDIDSSSNKDNQTLSGKEKEKLFGRIQYEVLEKGRIKILGDWQSENIVKVFLPELEGVKGAPKDQKIYFHRLAAPQLVLFFSELDKTGLTKYILTWDGSFVPRLIRGRKSLSSHAYGIAFDINAHWNGLGRCPAGLGEAGTVRPLVEQAEKYGFFWGGNFERPDGMHFEVNRII